jgi:hypothetical protein
MSIDRELLRWLRRATVIAVCDRVGLVPALAGAEPLHDTAAALALARAAVVLGLASGDPPRWSDEMAEVVADRDRWRRLISLIEHQTSYLGIAGALGSDRTQSTPAAQLAAAPGDYHGFLRGVDASHRRHAAWVAALPALAGTTTLVDVGAGLGTFSWAWLAADPRRRAVLVDLPAVVPSPPDDIDAARWRMVGLDLLSAPALPAGDLHLFANVLHLLAPARRLAIVAAAARAGGRIAIFEPSRDGDAGALFDLQVRLRSGFEGALFAAGEVEELLTGAGARAVAREDTADPDDPFGRSYHLWIAQVP